MKEEINELAFRADSTNLYLRIYLCEYKVYLMVSCHTNRSIILQSTIDLLFSFKDWSNQGHTLSIKTMQKKTANLNIKAPVTISVTFAPFT